MANSNIPVLNAVLLQDFSDSLGVTGRAIVRGASKALAVARQLDWKGGESRQIGIVVTSQNRKVQLSYMITYDFKS